MYLSLDWKGNQCKFEENSKAVLGSKNWIFMYNIRHIVCNIFFFQKLKINSNNKVWGRDDHKYNNVAKSPMLKQKFQMWIEPCNSGWNTCVEEDFFV